MPSAAAHETELLLRDRQRARRSPWLFVLLSVGVHALGYALVGALRAERRGTRNGEGQ